MGRKRIRDIRNEELIAATIRAAHGRGFGQITLADVGHEADISPASVSYYFGSKDQLMAAVIRRLLSILHEALLARLARAHTPRERLHAMIAANFDEALFTPAHCTIWVEFWSFAPHVPALHRLHRLNRARVRSNFRATLRALLPEPRQEVTRRAIQAYMDGVWVEAAQSKTPPSAKAAQLEARQVVELILAAPENLLLEGAVIP